MTLAERHTQISSQLIQRAETYFQSGDMTKASQSAWDAVEFCLKTIAERRGWSHESHLDLSRVVSGLAEESDTPRRIRTIFLRMTGLHINAYEDWYSPKMVKDGIAEAKELIPMLEKV